MNAPHRGLNHLLHDQVGDRNVRLPDILDAVDSAVGQRPAKKEQEEAGAGLATRLLGKSIPMNHMIHHSPIHHKQPVLFCRHNRPMAVISGDFAENPIKNAEVGGKFCIFWFKTPENRTEMLTNLLMCAF